MGRTSGLTLLEVIVATTIFSVAVLGVLGGISLCSQRAYRMQRLDRAAEIAACELELATTLPASKLQAYKGADDRHRWEVDYRSRPHDLMLATVKVSWVDRGREESFQLAQVFMPQ